MRKAPLDYLLGRHFAVVVPPVAVAHIDAELGHGALAMMERNRNAEIVPAESCLR